MNVDAADVAAVVFDDVPGLVKASGEGVFATRPSELNVAVLHQFVFPLASPESPGILALPTPFRQLAVPLPSSECPELVFRNILQKSNSLFELDIGICQEVNSPRLAGAP